MVDASAIVATIASIAHFIILTYSVSPGIGQVFEVAAANAFTGVQEAGGVTEEVIVARAAGSVDRARSNSGLPNRVFSRSCKGKCGTSSPIPGLPCQCHNECVQAGNCCQDFNEHCHSCKNRCGNRFEARSSCQCNSRCHLTRDCCPDFNRVCSSIAGTRPTQRPVFTTTKRTTSIITDDELLTLSNTLLQLDERNPFATPLISLQGKTRSGSQEDLARQPLFGPQTASEAVVSGTSRLIKDLYDNYSPEVNNNEQVTQQHLNEEEAFFQVVLATEPMKRVVTLLQSRGLLPTNNRNLESILRTLWFERFSRSRGSLGSSGFEHIFLGEVKNAEPSGFHSWLYFKHQEEAGSLDYLGFIRSAKLSGKASLLELPLKWKGMYKPVNSMFVGTSPELEMALYTLCFYARPEAKCPMNGNSVKFFIQTYPFKSRGKVYLGTAYPTFR
ncbi:uridylate-specific endoribonuclease-like [Artemia franciscana]|uniref:Uncharacterized protein n=1 Tax=Artemia franciscana TaxID=6661 RepID=A0AA88HXD2_ARTSF|nr:hypothetical protein QYM36_007113 [Artemia franciscana]